MKRDMDLVRQILLKLEELTVDGLYHKIDIDGYTRDQISYHVMIMAEADLIDAQNSYDELGWCPIRITWEGHEFLDAARSDTVWIKAKNLVLQTAGVITLEAIKVALKQVITGLI